MRYIKLLLIAASGWMLVACGGGAGVSAPSYGIAGVVSGVPGTVKVAGVTMTLSGAAGPLSVTTNSLGEYSFADLTPGSYTVTPSLTGHAFTPATLTVPVSSASAAGIDFTGAPVASLTYSLSGSIAGTTIAGVTITLSGPAARTTVTDVNGNFTFTGLTSGSYTVVPTLAGTIFAPTGITSTISGADLGGLAFSSSAAPAATYILSGMVSGDAVNGVNVTLYNGAGQQVANTATDAFGYYGFPGLLDGAYTVTPYLYNHDFAPASLAKTINGANLAGNNFTSTLLATSGFSITGMTSGATGVTLSLWDNKTATATTAISDANGYYSFNNLNNGDYVAIPLLAGYTFGPSSQVVVINGASASGVVFTATPNSFPTVSLSGVITGTGKKKITVTLGGDGNATTLADSSGYFHFDGLAPGSYTLTPSNYIFSFAPATKTVAVGTVNVIGANFTATQICFNSIANCNEPSSHGLYDYPDGASDWTVPAGVNYIQLTRVRGQDGVRLQGGAASFVKRNGVLEMVSGGGGGGTGYGGQWDCNGPRAAGAGGMAGHSGKNGGGNTASPPVDNGVGGDGGYVAATFGDVTVVGGAGGLPGNPGVGTGGNAANNGGKSGWGGSDDFSGGAPSNPRNYTQIGGGGGGYGGGGGGGGWDGGSGCDPAGSGGGGSGYRSPNIMAAGGLDFLAVDEGDVIRAGGVSVPGDIAVTIEW